MQKRFRITSWVMDFNGNGSLLFATFWVPINKNKFFEKKFYDFWYEKYSPSKENISRPGNMRRRIDSFFYWRKTKKHSTFCFPPLRSLFYSSHFFDSFPSLVLFLYSMSVLTKSFQDTRYGLIYGWVFTWLSARVKESDRWAKGLCNFLEWETTYIKLLFKWKMI